MELVDTINGMLSDDYTDRLKAEYQQLIIRIDGLERYLKNNRTDIRDIEREAMYIQLYAMLEYKKALQLRAMLMNIKIKGE